MFAAVVFYCLLCLATAELLTGLERLSVLTVHNEHRCAKGVPPLRYSCSLEKAANEIVSSCPAGATDKTQPGALYAKYGGVLGSSAAQQWPGENVAHGAAGNFEIKQLAGVWFAEKTRYLEECATNAPCSFDECGHYTMAMWSSSTVVGCAVGRGCTRDDGVTVDILLCLYFEAGNFEGTRPFPVEQCDKLDGVCASQMSAPATCAGAVQETAAPPSAVPAAKPAAAAAGPAIQTAFGAVRPGELNAIMIGGLGAVVLCFLCCVLATVCALGYRSRYQSAVNSSTASGRRMSTFRGNAGGGGGGGSASSRAGRSYRQSSRRQHRGGVGASRRRGSHPAFLETDSNRAFREADTPPIIPQPAPMEDVGTITFDDAY